MRGRLGRAWWAIPDRAIVIVGCVKRFRSSGTCIARRFPYENHSSARLFTPCTRHMAQLLAARGFFVLRRRFRR
jgi:hypothetical protein